MEFIYLNFTDLNADAQERLTEAARNRLDIEIVKEEAKNLNINFEQLLLEKIDGELPNADYIFNI